MTNLSEKILGEDVSIDVDGRTLDACLDIPAMARGFVIFAHGSGSGRFSPRNRYVAGVLNAYGFGTLLADLLTPTEAALDSRTGHLRFDIGFLARRLDGLADWACGQEATRGLPLGLFGASTGAAAALEVAAQRQDIAAVVSRGGRPDLAMPVLDLVTAPVLLIVGSRDLQVLEWNRMAKARLKVPASLSIIAAAGHLFEEPGTLEAAAAEAAKWFGKYLPAHG